MGRVRRGAIGRGAVLVPAVWALAIAGRRLAQRRAAERSPGHPVTGVTLRDVLDTGDGLWRGPMPVPDTYAELAAAGVTLIVDLRAEAEVDMNRVRGLAEQSALDVLWLPTGNARAPHPSDFDRFTRAHETNTGITYVHCVAGEGRTGALVGAYQLTKGAPVRDCISDALRVGSLTYSQLAFLATGGRTGVWATVLEYTVDRPTEALFDIARRRGR